MFKANAQSSYQQVENKKSQSESQQQQEDFSEKAKNKTEEASKPTGNVMKETFQEPKKSGDRQVYVSTNINIILILYCLLLGIEAQMFVIFIFLKLLCH